jgi:CRP/FNR family cyclic AMP-dependent transcriptional regulator
MIDQTVSAQLIGNIPLLYNFNETERRQMADIAVVKHFAPGEVIVRQGEDSQVLWVVLEGKCEVVKHPEQSTTDSIVLAILEPYSHFGEMSFFSPAPHSASVRAQTAVTALAIDRRDYDDLIRQGIWAAYKLAYNTVQGLADRLRRMDQWVAELAAHNPANERVPEWSAFRDKLFNGWNL